MNQDLYNHGIIQTLPSGLPFVPWTRDPEWLALPEVLSTDNKVAAVVRVDPGTANFIAFTFTAVGGYTVDWGDGNVVNYGSSITAYKQYDFDATPGTPTSEGFKQVVIVVTPQDVNPFTNVSLFVKHNQAGLGAYSTGILDLVIAAPSATVMTISTNATLISHSYMQRVRVISSAITSMASLITYCRALRVAAVEASGAVSSTASAFSNCSALTEVTLPTDLSSVTNMSGMFISCFKLTFIPDINGGQASTGFAQMFQNCYSLRYGPRINFPTSTALMNLSCTQMFQNCFSLLTIPTYDFSRVTIGTYMFQTCNSLIKLPALNFSRVTDFTGFCSSAASLQSCGTLTTSTSLITMGTMFASCTNLLYGPDITVTSNVTSMSSAFSGCSSLRSVPLYDTQSNTTMASTFTNCRALRTVPLFNTGAVTTFSQCFLGCTSLTSIPAFDYSSCINISSYLNGATAITEIGGPIVLANSATINASVAFAGCSALTELPTLVFGVATTSVNLSNLTSTTPMNDAGNIDCSDVTSAASVLNILSTCPNLKNVQLTGLRFGGIAIAGQLSPPSLIALFESLGTASGAQTITVSGNWGWASLTAADKLIATSKGWTLA